MFCKTDWLVIFFVTLSAHRALSFFTLEQERIYALLFSDPASAALLAWGVSMTTRQAGHFFFEPQGYDEVNQATQEHKEAIKVGYNLRRKVVLSETLAQTPLGALRQANRRHDVVAVQILDRFELELPPLGYLVLKDAETGEVLSEVSESIGVTTNNVAEYRALILGLEKAWALGGNRVTAYLDSELVVRQLRGEFKVREAHLKPLHQQAL